MRSDKVLFVAGNLERLASVKIRCRDVAARLGFQCYFNATDPEDIPSGYRLYVCVKPVFGAAGAQKLLKKGAVIWDILDDNPPEGMSGYLASTALAAAMFQGLNRPIFVIPHYHCNMERTICCGDPVRVGYVGSAHWYPELSSVAHEKFIIDGWDRERVAEAYRSIGISVNLRHLTQNFDKFLSGKLVRPVTDLHIKVNSGLKLINCLGFGLPSVSAIEPAYQEIAPHCTIFCNLETCMNSIARLQNDRDLYLEMRNRCLAAAEAFHIDQVILKYRQILLSM